VNHLTLENFGKDVQQKAQLLSDGFDGGPVAKPSQVSIFTSYIKDAARLL